jgi:hypothetical protein
MVCGDGLGQHIGWQNQRGGGSNSNAKSKLSPAKEFGHPIFSQEY